MLRCLLANPKILAKLQYFLIISEDHEMEEKHLNLNNLLLIILIKLIFGHVFSYIYLLFFWLETTHHLKDIRHDFATSLDNFQFINEN